MTVYTLRLKTFGAEKLLEPPERDVMDFVAEGELPRLGEGICIDDGNAYWVEAVDRAYSSSAGGDLVRQASILVVASNRPYRIGESW